MNKTKFKQTEIGKIPVGWKQATLGEVSSDISYGYTASASDIPLGPKFLRITDIQGGYVDWHSVPYCQISDKDKERYRLDHGDICIARTGASTGTNYTVKNKVDAVFASYLIRYKINNSRVDPFYVGLLLKSPKWKDFVGSILGGSAQPGANAKQFASFEFPLPSFPEQRAIAKILSDLDEKIELNNQTNKILESIVQAIFKKWFVDFEFPGYEKTKIVNGLPDGWREGMLIDVCDIVMGQSPPGETYNESGDGVVFYQGNRDFGFRFPTPRVYCTDPTRIAEVGDVLISVRAPVGALNITLERCAIGRGVAALRMKQYSNGFLFYFLSTRQDLWDRFNSEGTVFGCLNKTEFQKVGLIIPSDAVMEQFDVVIKPIEAMIRKNEIENRLLVEIRDSLLPKLMSGKLLIA